MIDPMDVLRAANLLIRHHGADNAPFVAARRADELLERGDVEGQIVWKKIAAAVVELVRTKARPDERFN
jgi:hypothetical protein